jgi:hypothetical protein
MLDAIATHINVSIHLPLLRHLSFHSLKLFMNHLPEDNMENILCTDLLNFSMKNTVAIARNG